MRLRHVWGTRRVVDVVFPAFVAMTHCGRLPGLSGMALVWEEKVERAGVSVVELLAMEGRCPLLKRFRHGRPDRGR
jgi:hypothetical protein